MKAHIVVAGESQCQLFAQICLVADHLSKNLPDFGYERIEKSVLEWKTWLSKLNQKYKWHHIESPIIWKEILMKGSKPYYIGGASEFLDYCHSYYQFDLFFSSGKFESLVRNFSQYQKKVKHEQLISTKMDSKTEITDLSTKINFVVTISGAHHPITMYIISGLLEMTNREKNIMKIYTYDSDCYRDFMKFVERECSYIGTYHSTKTVKHVEKIGIALANTDLLIILDHVPFDSKLPIGDWLLMNRVLMEKIAAKINASAPRKLLVLFANLGPACYNATILMNATNIDKKNIIVATSDLGLEVAPFISEIAEVPMRNIFCSPVWGFVGINHLVDIRTTVHKYNSFQPYNRFTRVKNSTLNIGSVTPEMRTLEYLVYFDESLWIKVSERKAKQFQNQIPINKAIAVLNIVKMWLYEHNSEEIVNLGIKCDGTFGLTFDGIFSQPARFTNGEWIPASEFMMPKDPQINLVYLEEMANFSIKLKNNDLPPIIPYYPCVCKRKFIKKKMVW